MNKLLINKIAGDIAYKRKELKIGHFEMLDNLYDQVKEHFPHASENQKDKIELQVVDQLHKYNSI